MSITDRQNRLLVAEDWKRIYQTFRSADFQSYDFDNLRRTMIQYLRENYPEDFNDYIESSEYLALIDLIAFLGQNLAFRIDLNARENFLELAERRESVLRLARLLSYNPKRNQAANGLLKIVSAKTTENILDSTGFNLTGQTILWNDSTNSNWNEQFTRILNAALPVNGTIGKPTKKETVSGIPTEQYRFNALNTTVPVFTYEKNIEGQTSKFQIVSTTIKNGEIAEESPLPGRNFAFLYRNDGAGAGSSNTGFFAHFRQGILDTGEFSVVNPTTNQAISIDTTNINNSDIWLYKLNSNKQESELWTKVDAVEGNNVIYNSLNKNLRSIYSVITRVDDRINLMFSDGVFGDLPRGNFRIYYRTSANKSMVITPRAMTGITIQVPYLSKAGKAETLTLGFELKYTVANGAPSESSSSIKANAPATYYTQNRMVTGEDYNVAPLGISQDIIKVKAVNRTASGLSRYFDLVDATGKYSSTNLYATDGVLYKEELEKSTTFDFVSQTDIEGVILNKIEPILQNKLIRNYYYEKYPKLLVNDLGATWNQVTTETNRTTGYFTDADSVRYLVGSYTSNNLRFLETETLCKFIAPTGYRFDKNNKLQNGATLTAGDKAYIWTKVVSVVGDGSTNTITGLGPVALSDHIPTGALLEEIKTKLATTILDDVKTQMIDQTYAYNTFGLRYDNKLRNWRLITNSNIDTNSEFSIGKAGDITSQNLDASWLLKFETNGEVYTVTYRQLRYVFESDSEVHFYYDATDKVYDQNLGKVIKDKISVLSINTQPDLTIPFTHDYDWEIHDVYRDREGYIDSTRVEVSFFDDDDDGVVDDPDAFDSIVREDKNSLTKYIFQQKYLTQDSLEDYRYITSDEANIVTYADESKILVLDENVVYFLEDERRFKVIDTTTGLLTYTDDYRAYIGRSGLKFHYLHNASANHRIDPSVSNIMDVYMLTKGYDVLFRQYLNETISTKPKPPSSDQLYRDYGQDLNKIKSISDEVIYQPVKYKILFGNKAKEDLQASFKIIKNPELVLNDNDIKSRAIEAINQYFALENWDFGNTFYFQELVTYVTNILAPDIVSMVIVPRQTTQTFGSLFEIRSESDEIFINGATVSDVEIIDEITASKLKASGNVVTASSYENAGIQSADVTTSGGFDY